MELRVEETPTRLRLSGEYSAFEALREHFKYRPPDYWRSPAYQLYKQTFDDPMGPKGWDGYKNLIEMNGRSSGSIMRGHKEEFLSACEEFGVKVRGTFLASPFIGLTVDDVPPRVIKSGFDLDQHQRTCIVNLLRHGTGVVRVTVSGGKTAIFGAVSQMTKQRIPSARVLYVTPTERLVNQVFTEMKKFLPGWKISKAGGGSRDFDGRDMVVATMATLHRNVKKLVADGWFKTFTVLLVDEVHHAPAETWSTVIRLVPALFRFGASDTVKDERKEDIVLKYAIRGLFGPVRAEVDVAPLIQTGRVARPTLRLIDVPEWEGEYDHLPHRAELDTPAEWEGEYDHLPHRAELDTPAWCLLDGQWLRGIYKGGAVDETTVDSLGQPNPTELTGFHTIELPDRGLVDVESRWCLLERAYDVAVIRNKRRNKLITEWATHFAKAKGWPTLVVATRTLHVLILEQLLTQAGLDVDTLTGEDTSKRRDEVFRWVTGKGGRVLISPLVKEGVSLPELRGGVVADVVASPDLARQIIGRFIRKKPTGDNRAEIAWFIDRQYKSARRNCLNLFEHLEKIRGYAFSHPCAGPEQLGLLYGAADFE